MWIKKLILALSAALTIHAQAQNECPQADVGFSSGCHIFPENTSQPLGRKVTLFYEWFGTRSNSLPTIIVINGGPGGDLRDYIDIVKILPASGFNILFYDQRGTGRSNPLKSEDIGAQYLENYHTSNNVTDLEELRLKVIGDDQVILLGHSYGAHIGLAYAAKYPKNVAKIIAANGSADLLGTAMQPYSKKIAVEKILQSIEPNKLLRFFEVIDSGEALQQNGEKFAYNDFVAVLRDSIKTYKGQTETVNKTIELIFSQQLRNANGEKIKKEIPNDQRQNQFRISGNKSKNGAIASGLNTVVNTFIVCHDLAPQAALEYLPQGDSRESLKKFRKQFCENDIQNKYKDEPFDVKEQLSQIKAPLLLAGGAADPIIPLEIQIRDYEIVSKANKQVTLLNMENVGHDFFSENTLCSMGATDLFLRDKLPEGKLNCAAIQPFTNAAPASLRNELPRP